MFKSYRWYHWTVLFMGSLLHVATSVVFLEYLNRSMLEAPHASVLATLQAWMATNEVCHVETRY